MILLAVATGVCQVTRSDVEIAGVKTLDIMRAGVPTVGEEARGLVVLSKEGGHWKVIATRTREYRTRG